MKSFIDNRLTDDFIWEDPTMKLIGKDEFEDMMGLSKYVSDVEFEVLSERHSTHEMLLDWKLKVSEAFHFQICLFKLENFYLN